MPISFSLINIICFKKLILLYFLIIKIKLVQIFVWKIKQKVINQELT